ncbi:MAG: hypothetical protein ACLFUG_01050 [Nitriliruptoraceae bacterium]
MDPQHGLDLLPAPREVPPPESFGRGSWPRISADDPGSPGTRAVGFPIWAARQYSQLIGPIHHGLSSVSRAAVAERTNLSRNAVQSALDGAGWPQLHTVLRLGFVAEVEVVSYSGRDLVDRGMPLPADEQALLRAFRQLGAEAQWQMHRLLREHTAPRHGATTVIAGNAVGGVGERD